MTRKLTVIPFLVLFASLFFTFACKRNNDDVSGNEDDEGIDQVVASDRINSVETEKPPRSEKVENDFVVSDTTYANPDIVYDVASEEGQAKIELLINGSASASAKIVQENNSAFAWILAAQNGEQVANKDKYLFIFSIDGKYLKFNNSEKSADWGYYYLDSMVTKMGFDYSNGNFEQLFKLIEITDNTLIVNHNGNRLSFRPYDMEGVASNRFEPENEFVEDTTKPTPSENFLVVPESSSETDVDVIQVVGNKLGSDGSALTSLSISIITENDTAANYLATGFINNISGFSETEALDNPIILSGEDTNDFDITITIDNADFSGEYSYTITLENENGYSDMTTLGFGSQPAQ